jgi:UMF1 family MFS transporter
VVINCALGVSVVFYNSYMPLMVDDSSEVREAMAAAAAGLMSGDEARAVQDKVGSEYSTKVGRRKFAPG